MDNTAIGLAVILGPICLAIVVLVVIEMTDRIPFPKAETSSETGAPLGRPRKRKDATGRLNLVTSNEVRAATRSDAREEIRPLRPRRIK